MASQNTQPMPSIQAPTPVSAAVTASASRPAVAPSTTAVSSASTAPSTPKKEMRLIDPAILSVCKGPSLSPPSSCFDLDDVVTVCVIDKHKRRVYKVLRKLLMWHSSYFAAALDPEGGWAPTVEPHLELEADHAVFDASCCWLFTERLLDLAVDPTDAQKIFLPVETLVKIWLFADLRGIPALGNTVIDMLHAQFYATHKIHDNIVKLIYKNTLAGSKLRVFIADMFKALATLNLVTGQSQHYTKEFLCDVLPAVAQRSSLISCREFTTMDRCRWHDHSGQGGKLRKEGRK